MMRERRFSGGSSLEPPCKVGDEFDVKIEGIAAKGDGIARIKGFIVFVPGVKEGDSVKIRIAKVLSKVGFAEVVSKIEGGVESSEESQAPAESAEESEAESEDNKEDTENFGEEEQ